MSGIEINDIKTNEIETDDNVLFTAYFKKGTAYYLCKLEQYKNGNRYTFNRYAFFFGIFWFMYRKMYVEAFIIFMAIVAEGFLEGVFTANMTQTAVTAISRITTIAIGIITAMLANSLYLGKVEREIIKARRDTTDRAALIRHLEQKGGVSYWFLIVAILALVAIVWYFYKLNNQG